MIKYGFEPTIDEQTTGQLMEQYKQNPEQFQPQQQQLLQDHAEHYKITPPETQLAENGFGSMLSQAGKGWIAGFTTLNIDHGDADKQPRTSWERIARSLGHLGGFVGFIPGVRTLQKIHRTSALATNLLKLRGQSIPLMAGKAATAGIKKTAIGLGKKGVDRKNEAVNSVAKFMNSVPGDMVEGSLNLGIASGVSSWQEGIHAVADSMFGGAIAGAGFRAIGNYIRVPGAKPVMPGTPLKELTSSQINEKALKGVAGSLMMGLPATMRGATTEEQIYDYLLGAFFGQGEMFVKNRRAIEHLTNMKTKYKDPETGVRGTSDPELVEGWKNLDAETKTIVKDITLQDAEQGGVISMIMARDNLDKMKAMQEADARAKEIYEGEPVERVKRPREERTESEGIGNDGETSPELKSSEPYEALFTKTKHYVQTYLEKEWIDAPDRQIAMEDSWRLINRKWNDVVQKNIASQSTENPAQEMIEWVNKKYKKNITASNEDAEWSFWTRWGQGRIHNKPVQVASIALDINPANRRARKTDPEFEVDMSPDVSVQIMNPNLEPNAMNLAGNSKQLREPVKVLEEAFAQEYFKRYNMEIDAKTEPVYTVLNDIVTNRESGGKFFKEQTFSDYRRDLTKTAEIEANRLEVEGQWEGLKYQDKLKAREQFVESSVERAYNNTIATSLKQMADKGYLYLGGKGDAERLYFVREHPAIKEKMTFEGGTTRRKQGNILKELNKVFQKGMSAKQKAQVDKDYKRESDLFVENFSKNYAMSESMRKFTLSETQARQLFDKGYLNNILYDLSMNGLPFTREGFAKLNESGMINTAKNYNKRSQIWFTNGIPADPKYVKEFVAREAGYELDDRGIRYALLKDTDIKGLHIKSNAKDYVHTMDGEIITLPELVDAFNSNQGLPFGQGSGYTNKSFIVSPSMEHGALLGKYQFKAADAKLAQAMRDHDGGKGIQMLIPESSAKQYGKRHLWDRWSWNGKDVKLEGTTPNEGNGYYRLPVNSIKVVPSEITSKKFIKPQRLPKQMQSNLTPFGHKSIKQEVIDDVFNRASEASFFGQKKLNEVAEKFLKNELDTVSEQKLLENVEDLGVPQLLELINSPKHEKFTAKIYNKILRINEEIVSEMQNEGEISSQDAHNVKLDAMEWQSVFDRIVKLKPDSLVPILHKVGDNYRSSVMRNYILSQITKPRLLNSATSRMTGYDAYMQKKFPEMQTNDNIFYLDEGYRQLKIHMDDGKIMTLGEIYENSQKPGRQSKEVLERYEDVMQAVALRVPMDSLSGAHHLTFKGFTGREGFGSVLHPRTMEALGGADLDGDKASFFFGGEANGFKKAWREAYGAQKGEYYTSSGAQGKVPLTKIISGVQTGADIAGNEIALELGLKTGGTAPPGFATADGKKPEYASKYGVKQVSRKQTKDYKGREKFFGPRTQQNVLDSDGTVIFGNMKSPGSKLTRNLANKNGKPVITNPTSGELNSFLRENNIKTLNVAGNREASNKGINKKVKDIIREAVKVKKGTKNIEVEHNKPQDMKELLTSQDFELLDRIKKPSLRWSPLIRYEASKGAYQGRSMLGPAVVNRSSILSAYNQVRTFLEANNLTQLEVAKGEFLTPKMSKAELKKFRRIARASVAFASDPMDEAGLKGTDVFFNAVFDSLFKANIVKTGPNGPFEINNQGMTTAQRKKFFVGIMSGINSAAFGRNLTTGKAHSAFDFQEAIRRADELPATEQNGIGNSFNGKIAKLARNIDFSDSILHRVDRFKLEDWYDGIRERLSAPEYQEIMQGLDRRSFSIPKNRPLDIVLENNLFNLESRRDFQFPESKDPFSKNNFNALIEGNADYFYDAYLRENTKTESYSQVLPKVGQKIEPWLRKTPKEVQSRLFSDSITKDRVGIHQKISRRGKKVWVRNNNKFPHDTFTKADIIKLLGSGEALTITQRRKVLEDLVKLASDSISNDMGDWASAKLIREVWQKDSISREKFNAMAKEVDLIQRLKSKLEKERDAIQGIEELGMDENIKTKILELERSIEGETTTREMDQRQVDGMISQAKERMTQAESDLFDAMLISSWKKGNPELVKGLKKAKENIDKSKTSYGFKSYRSLQNYLNKKEKQLDQTKFNRVGFASKEVSDSIIKRQLDIMEEAFESFRYEDSKRDTRVAEKIVENLELENRKQPLFNENGERTQGLAIQASDYSTKTQKYLDEYAPFSGLLKNKDIKATSKSRKILAEIKDHMDFYGPKTREDLHLIVRGMINKDINAMKLEDWEIVRNLFRDARNGTWFQKTFSKVKDSFPTLKKRYYRMFPEAIDRDIMRHEIKWNETEALYKDTYGNWITGKAKNTQGWMGEIQNHIHLSQELATMENQREERKWSEATEKYTGTELGQGLWDYAVRSFEAQEMPARIRARGKTGDAITEENAKTYERRAKIAEEEIEWDKNSSKLLTVTGGVRKTGKELVKEIHELLAVKNFENHTRLAGNNKAWKEFVEKKPLKTKSGREIMGESEFEMYTTVDAKTGEILQTEIPVIKRKKMIEFFLDHLKHGKPFPVKEFGIDGMRKIVLGMQMGQIREAERSRGDKAPIRQVQLGGLSERLARKQILTETGILGTLKNVGDKPGIFGYFPHSAKFFEKGVLTGDLTQKIKTIWASNRPREEKIKMVTNLYLKSKQLSGDFIEADAVNESWEVITDAIIKKQQGKKIDNEIKWFDKLDKVGNQFSRENHIDGWETSPEAYLDYSQTITKTLYKQIGQILSRETINEFSKTHKDMPDNLRIGWMNFFKLYAQQSLGFPAVIPKEMFDNEDMKIKGTLYGALADNRVAFRLDQIGRKLNLIGKGKELPKELRSLDKIDAQAVVNLGNAEAKYALATLLAHPKSSVGNYLGGSQMTIVNAGLNNFINAKSIDYLRKTIDPKFKSWEDVNKWVRELGIIEEFIIREIGANPRMTGPKWNAFLKDFRQSIAKDPNLPDVSLKDLYKKHNLSKGMMDVAGKFMSLPERSLRRDSFIAHYLQARDKLGGRTLPKDHPYLIEMGKRGVKATQFLYSVPFRPMFSGTAMGKVVSRFQLWAWNSVRYRNTINREAAIRGIRPGSPEYDRFKRLMIADTLSIALGSMFMYSLFGSQLPQPYAWFQDLSEWLFGNEKERDRAFFGAYPGKLAPLQLITPPSFRLTGPILNGLINDDWEKMSNYYAWTMFPFGRLARDLVGPGGLTENPYYGIDKLTGIPVVGAKRIATARKKEEEKGTEFWKPPGLRASSYFNMGDE